MRVMLDKNCEDAITNVNIALKVRYITMGSMFIKYSEFIKSCNGWKIRAND